MTTTMPESHNIRSAVKWISSELQEESHLALNDLIQQAILRYDLSPAGSEKFVTRFINRTNQKTNRRRHSRRLRRFSFDAHQCSRILAQVECPPACRRFETGLCA